MATTEKADVRIRAVTDEEVAHFFEKGWVTLRKLIEPERAAEMLKRAQSTMGLDGNGQTLREGKDIDSEWFKDYHDISHEDEVFREVVQAPIMGENTARLLERDTPVRLLTDTLAVKLPAESGRGSVSTWHQDYNLLPFDRVTVNLWIALDQVVPEQGPLEFYSRSNKLGMLGAPPAGSDYAGTWPRVADWCELEGPGSLEPGDATIHSSLTIHGAGTNESGRPRWAYLVSYFPADTRFVNKPYRHTNGLGLEHNKVIEHPKFPLVYTPGE
jgi:hypothetical protein